MSASLVTSWLGGSLVQSRRSSGCRATSLRGYTVNVLHHRTDRTTEPMKISSSLPSDKRMQATPAQHKTHHSLPSLARNFSWFSSDSMTINMKRWRLTECCVRARSAYLCVSRALFINKTTKSSTFCSSLGS